MSLPGGARASGPLLHPRLCAALTVVSCLVHLGLAAEGHHGAWLEIVMLTAAAVCLPCAVHIWQHSRLGALHQVTASALAMVALHSVLLLGSSGAGHAHSRASASSIEQTPDSTQLLLVIGLELATALLAATLVARLRVSRRPAAYFPLQEPMS